MNRLGARQFLLVGVPPMGCLPVVKFLMMSTEGCYQKFNDVAMSFNSKLVKRLALLKKQLSVRAAYLDIYRVFEEVTKYPMKFGKLHVRI